MSEQIVKNQHYISQCILRHFANENGQVYEALVDEKRVYPTNYRNAMSERWTYEHPDLEKNNLERYFAKIEQYMGKVAFHFIETTRQHEEGAVPFSVIKGAIQQYIREIIIFYYRSGALLHEFEFQRDHKHDRIPLMFMSIMNSRYIKALGATLTNNYEAAIIKSADGRFLMSDQYLSTAALKIKNRFTTISNRHIGLRDILILIPISKHYYFVYFHGNKPDYIRAETINDLQKEQLEEINSVIVNNSYTKCIAGDKGSLELSMGRYKVSVKSNPPSTANRNMRK